ncbi:NACHT domain-containing protein [Actinomadura luteofluorescens]|uniref:NACHT domain-containing protein n=1 Tax=Actinomadura luteofluorescens TaxID=46163 RepID=UPI003D8C5F1F
MLGDLSARGVSTIFTSIRKSKTSVTDTTPSLELYAIPGGEGEESTSITAQDLTLITTLLETPESSAIVTAYALSYMSDKDRWDRAQAFAQIEQTFIELTRKWGEENGGTWGDDLGRDIWRQITEYLSTILPDPSDLDALSNDDVEHLRAYLGKAGKLAGKQKPVPLFVRSLVQIVNEDERLNKARDAVFDIRRAVSDSYSELRLQHVQEDFRFEMSDLYIERTLLDRETAISIPTLDLVQTPTSRPHFVVVGDPGVGKSTLVGHLIHMGAEQNDDYCAPLLIRCRDYAAMQPQPTIIEAMASWLLVEFSLTVDPATIEDILTLGRAFIVFDGIDEILDVSKRRDFIRTIESFARRFPLVGIVATSRKVGYSRASFNDKVFRLLELQEFTPEQVAEYAEKWFRSIRRSNIEKDAFLRDSATIGDIRSNPLMLSLLCTLYRMRGFIPQNRRHVYRECAELLFNRWDSMRQIEQPYDHRHYGQRLVQELALFYYRSQTAQAGVEERQLRKIIASFFRDTGGAEMNDAESRAEDFLDFCADRAWLLTKKGSSERGDRIFGFTHRTFMEYFAAEALVRRAASADVIVEDVVKAYESDPASVLADVIVQCFDEKQDRGAEQIISALIRPSRDKKLQYIRYLVLALRIINACPVNGVLADRLLKDMLRRCSSPPYEISMEATVALFELYRDPRVRLSQLLKDEQENEEVTQPLLNLGFCHMWVRYLYTEYSFLYRDQWQTIAHEALKHLGESLIPGDPVLTNHMVNHGYSSANEVCESQFTISELLRTRIFDSLAPGAVLLAIVRSFAEPEIPSHVQTTLEWFASWTNRGISIGAASAMQLDRAVTMLAPDWSGSRLHRERISDNAALRTCAFWLTCTITEVTYPSIHPFTEHLDYVVGRENFGGMLANHLKHHGIDEVDLPTSDTAVRAIVPRLTRPQAYAVLENFPRWTKSWYNGRRLTTLDEDFRNIPDEGD